MIITIFLKHIFQIFSQNLEILLPPSPTTTKLVLSRAWLNVMIRKTAVYSSECYVQPSLYLLSTLQAVCQLVGVW